MAVTLLGIVTLLSFVQSLNPSEISFTVYPPIDAGIIASVTLKSQSVIAPLDVSK